MKPIKTKLLYITPSSADELRAAVHREADPHMKQALSEMLAGCEADPKQYLWYTDWLVTLRESGETVGSLGFKGPPKNGEVELGYGIDPAFAGHGYATEAAKALIDWAFTQPEVYFIMGEAEAENAASLRILEKLGFVPAGQGEEGPRFEKERPIISWMSIYMCLGVGTGMSFGAALDKLSIGMCLGVAIGLALGTSLDAADKKKRADLRKLREK